MGLGGGAMVKAAVSKAAIIKINLAFLALFLVAYVALLFLHPSSLLEHNSTKFIRCSLRDCHIQKVDGKVQQKLVREEKITKPMEKVPSFLEGSHGSTKIGLVNMEDDELLEWSLVGKTVTVKFEQVTENFKWLDLFPEWIDEEEENEGASCPEIPMPDFSLYGEMDVVVAKLPCRRPRRQRDTTGGNVSLKKAGGGINWARDVMRLQVHLAAANLAVQKGRRSKRGTVKVVLHGECDPMMEIFRCDDLAAAEGRWRMYEVPAARLEEKVALPVGSCKLAVPLWEEGTIDQEYDLSKFTGPANPRRREAYATVLHSSDAYLCGAIALAQSIIKTGSTRDLVLLHDNSIPGDKLAALVNAGWTIRLIERIRNPYAEKDSYNEYNYSKLRLWLLTDYAKIVFVDADILVLRNLDFLFHFPEISAVGNDGVIFNSGVMVVEPSNCTFRALMALRHDIISYNGGDQGFLNEVFVWWHRLPRRMNFLKNFWSNTTAEASVKNQLFGADDPPKLYAIHYLGLKPWLCYRDYDCNWNVANQRIYASDAAHRTWWRLHDAMEDRLKKFCELSPTRREYLDAERRQAEELGLRDGHWRWNISDDRRSSAMNNSA